MDDRNNFNNRPEQEKGKNSVLKTLGVLGVAIFLAVLTVLLINL
jgi:hypothetical protein